MLSGTARGSRLLVTSFEDRSRVQMPLGVDLRRSIRQRYTLELAVDAVHLDGGDECAIWRCGDVVVRIAPSWRTDDELRFTHDLASHVSRTVPEAVAPIAAADGSTFFRFGGHPVAVFPFIAGDPFSRSLDLVRDAGELLARVHAANRRLRGVVLPPSQRHDRVPVADELRDEELVRWHDGLSTRGEPRLVIHGDVYGRNLLVRDGRIAALLDWDEAHEDFIGQEIAWSMWEFSKVDGVRIDEPFASAFLDGYVSAGGRLPPAFRENAIAFIRWRLRDELHVQLTARARGEAFDEEYFETELTAFTNLRGSELFGGRFLTSETEHGRTWLASVPELVRDMCARWGLEVTGESPSSGAWAVVTPVRRDEDAGVLKLTMDLDAAGAEIAALRAWDGRGAVRLLDADAAAGALLLERAGPQTLRDVELFDAAEVAGAIIRRLAIAAAEGFPQQRDRAHEIASSLPERQRALGDPITRRWLDAAAALARDLAAGDQGRLVHSDLHYVNVLRSEREPWLVIDPRPVCGDPELSVPELLWTRHDELDRPSELEQLLDIIVRSGDLDAGRARAWVIVRSVDYWLWGLQHGLTEDPIRCRRILEVLA